MTNMAIEAGGKNGIFPVDDLTIEYMKEHSTKEYKVYNADADAQYDETYVIHLDELKPTVAFPHLPENTRTIDEVGEVKIDQVVIGSCTNGRMEDLRIAAKIMEGRHVAEHVRTIVIPATQKIYTNLRTLPRWTYGNPCKRRESRCNHKQKLCRTYGRSGI